jgi:hypothetical protein
LGPLIRSDQANILDTRAASRRHVCGTRQPAGARYPYHPVPSRSSRLMRGGEQSRAQTAQEKCAPPAPAFALEERRNRPERGAPCTGKMYVARSLR